MAASRLNARALALVTAGVIVLAGCTSQQVLPADQAGTEPGYPQYTPPAAPTDPTDPTSSTAEPGTAAPGAEPSLTAPPTSTPSPSSSPSPSPSGSPAPTTSEPAPVDPTPGAPSPSPPTNPGSPAPTTPAPTSPAPPTPAPTTPTPATLQTQTWQPRCGAPLSAPSRINQLDLAVTLPTVPEGTLLQTEAVLTNQLDAPLAGDRYVASVTIARDGAVVSTWVEGQEAGPVISIAARGTLVVPVFHDLEDTCGATPAPELERVDPGAAAGASLAELAPAPVPAPELDAGASAGAGYLPAGSYTAVVAVHLVRDGAQATTVVASSGVLPLTIG